MLRGDECQVDDGRSAFLELICMVTDVARHEAEIPPGAVVCGIVYSFRPWDCSYGS